MCRGRGGGGPIGWEGGPLGDSPSINRVDIQVKTTISCFLDNYSGTPLHAFYITSSENLGIRTYNIIILKYYSITYC